MKFCDSIRLAVLSVSAKKSKVFLNVLGIVIGLSSVIIIMSIGKGGQIAVMNQLDRFGINAVCIKPSLGKSGKLNDDDVEYLKKRMPEIECILPVYTNYATIKRDNLEKEAVIWGVGAGFDKLFPAQITSGRLFAEADVHDGKKVVVIDVDLAKRLFSTENAVGKSITLSANANTIELTVIGIISSNSKSFVDALGDSMPAFVYVPNTTAMSMYNAKALDYISIKTQNPSQLEQMGIKATRLIERKKSEKGMYYADNFANQKERLSDILNIFTFVISAAAAISLVVGGIGVMNLMLMSVTERTGEIGVMKAIGATNGDIMAQFMLESVFVTLCGGIIGVLLGISGAFGLSKISGLPFAIEVQNIYMAVLFSVAMGLIFGVYPAKKAAKLNPIEALRRE